MEPTVLAGSGRADPEPRSARADAIAALYGHAAALALAGDLAAARAVHAAITVMLGIGGVASPVVDLATERRRR